MSPERLAVAKAKLAENKGKTSSRGSRHAKERAQNMRQLYMAGAATGREETQEVLNNHHNIKQNTMISSLEDNWEQEAEKLYQWTQELTFEKTFDI